MDMCMVCTNPRGGANDAIVVRSGPMAVPKPAIEWQVAQAVPFDDFVKVSRPRVACAEIGGLSCATATAVIIAKTTAKLEAFCIFVPL
jgi:hypothetical protein